MAPTNPRAPAAPLHPFHAVLVAAALPLFIGAFLSDLAYSNSYHQQWLNFSSWLIAGALVFTGFALLRSVIGAIRARGRAGRRGLLLLLLLGLFVIGFVNALVHAKDAWATMPEGLILSAITALLALAAVFAGFSTLRTGVAK